MEDLKEYMNEVNSLWDKYLNYKVTAEQHEFVQLFILDMKLVPMYNDLKAHYNEDHAKIFIKVMKQVLKSLGIE